MSVHASVGIVCACVPMPVPVRFVAVDTILHHKAGRSWPLFLLFLLFEVQSRWGRS